MFVITNSATTLLGLIATACQNKLLPVTSVRLTAFKRFVKLGVVTFAINVCHMQVYRHLFADVFPLTFTLGLDAETDVKLGSLSLTIEELNNRTDYQGP